MEKKYRASTTEEVNEFNEKFAALQEELKIKVTVHAFFDNDGALQKQLVVFKEEEKEKKAK